MKTRCNLYIALGLAFTPLHAFELIEVPAGSFLMGDADIAIPVHEVTLTHEFLISQTELPNEILLDAVQYAHDNELVTLQGEWLYAYDVPLIHISLGEFETNELRYDEQEARFFLTSGTGYWGWGPGHDSYNAANHPANYMTWFGAACICDWLSLMEGLDPFYNGDWSGDEGHSPYEAEGFRLPTEAEWEYAARYPDGRTYPWGWQTGGCDVANTRLSGDYCTGWTTECGSYPDGDSALGLQDLVGNINEWVHDWRADYPAGPVTDPFGPPNGFQKILRGGSWTAQGIQGSLSFRRFESPNMDTGTPWYAGSFGMRVVLTGRQTVIEPTPRRQDGARLLPARPNPFNPSTTLRYRLDKAAHVRLSVFNLLGQEVALLQDGHQSTGEHRAVFHATGAPAGLYLAALESPGSRQVERILLMP